MQGKMDDIHSNSIILKVCMSVYVEPKSTKHPPKRSRKNANRKEERRGGTERERERERERRESYCLMSVSFCLSLSREWCL